jgi:hypothetical protein
MYASILTGMGIATYYRISNPQTQIGVWELINNSN